jgi:cytochrome b involved in lipid metabolism
LIFYFQKSKNNDNVSNPYYSDVLKINTGNIENSDEKSKNDNFQSNFEKEVNVNENSNSGNQFLKFYSLKEVEVHNSKESCWSVIKENVYDLISWISNHLGGEKAILNICDKNGTQLFEKQHGGKEKQKKY